ncbi:MAG TPA: bifunctional nuclease family protein [bacterium (Candidatus Stahlbacteria)]|nr:bifunctional nuclease family protein [Candidatus Stahlbacteria bacterium]
MIEVTVTGVIQSPDLDRKSYIVLLKEIGGDRILPIWIGENEAMAIMIALEKITYPRPLTHDLIKLLTEALGVKIIRVVVSDLKEDTYYARVFIQKNGSIISIDARPSDSIAVALRSNAQIFVDDRIIETNAMQIGDEEKLGKLKEHLKDLNPEDFGNFKIR